ncbi:hypothetical protein [Gulosibacter sp. 10]|uniref:hypothetical protein n=1 Tax=Gulosibacter sp. 10 TaxID=1255570 RepID=UPI00097EDC80|nr:hypothetical protein [Gulosibacter sp. 10]SJM71254.1 hypothetical protein FM112_16005 [Gulosibacter sp. 10]
MAQDDDGTTPVEAQIERLLAEAEHTVEQLRRELDEARARRARETELREQHEEVDRLREYLVQAQVRWGAVRDFFESALRELGDRTQEASGDDEAEEGPR